MLKNNRKIFIQALGLIAFCIMAAASSSSQHANSSDGGIDWRGAAVGAGAGYNGYIPIGKASSESGARSLASNKGYSAYLWDSVNGVVYGK